MNGLAILYNVIYLYMHYCATTTFLDEGERISIFQLVRVHGRTRGWHSCVMGKSGPFWENTSGNPQLFNWWKNETLRWAGNKGERQWGRCLCAKLTRRVYYEHTARHKRHAKYQHCACTRERAKTRERNSRRTEKKIQRQSLMYCLPQVHYDTWSRSKRQKGYLLSAIEQFLKGLRIKENLDEGNS